MGIAKVNTNISIEDSKYPFPLESETFMGEALSDLDERQMVVGLKAANWELLMQRFSNISALPTNDNPDGIIFSNDDRYLIVPKTNNSPYLLVYRVDDSQFVQLPSNAIDIYPTGASYVAAYTLDGDIVMIGHNMSPYITMYKQTGDIFTKLPNLSPLPAGAVNYLSLSLNGMYLTFNPGTYAMGLYKYLGNGAFTKLTNPTNFPSSMYSSLLSPDCNYMAISYYNSPYIQTWSRDGDVFAKLADPKVPPSASCYSLAFSPDSRYLIASSSSSPYIFIFKHDNGVLTKLPNPNILPTGSGSRLAFSPDGKYIGIAHSNSPYFTLYKFDEGTLTKLPNPASLPTGNGYGIAFSHNGRFLVIGHKTTPFITIYTTVTNDTIVPVSLKTTSGYMLQSNFAGMGFTRESANKGDIATIDVLLKQ